MYTAKINILGKSFESAGDSVLAALSGLKPNGLTKAKSVLVVSRGQKSRDRVLTPMMTARLFSPSRYVRDIALKNTSILFDGV